MLASHAVLRLVGASSRWPLTGIQLAAVLNEALGRQVAEP
jgi:hypothetical protein